MKPSDRNRRRLMKFSSPTFISKCFHYCAAFCLFVGIAIALPVMRESTIAGLATLGGMGLFFIIFELVARLFVPWVNRLVTKNDIDYPVADVDISIDELLDEAAEMELPNELWYTEVNGDWIDIGWDWRNAISIGNVRGSKSVRIFKKMILVYEDHTYEELDMMSDTDINFGTGRLGASKNVQYGHISNKSIVVDLGMDLNSDHVGVNKYSLNTSELTNYIHKWMADRGYAKR